MANKVACFFAVVTILVGNASAQYPPTIKRPQGFVPDQTTAIQIAEAVLTPIYGADTVQKERPFKATLKNNVWTITGSLPNPGPDEVVLGGVAVVQLSKADGRILRVGHGK